MLPPGVHSGANSFSHPRVGSIATSGTVTTTTYGGYVYRVFTGNGSLTVSSLPVTSDVLVVAGGGGGASTTSYAGGGGGGGVINNSSYSLPVGTYTIAIGNGGSSGTQGQNTTFGSLFTAIGGGAGGALLVVLVVVLTEMEPVLEDQQLQIKET